MLERGAEKILHKLVKLVAQIDVNKIAAPGLVGHVTSNKHTLKV